VNTESGDTSTALCPTGYVAIGGGGSSSGFDVLDTSVPTTSTGTVVTGGDTPGGWEVIFAGDSSITAYVVCSK
jgi:hypothetical protein